MAPKQVNRPVILGYVSEGSRSRPRPLPAAREVLGECVL